MSGMRGSDSDIMRGNRDSEIESEFNRRTPGHHRWWKIPRRYHVALMCYLAFAIKGWMGTNLWTMFVHIFLMDSEERRLHFPTTSNWTVEELDTILDMNYWGAALIQIPAAIMTICYSPHKVMLISFFLSSILHMLIPSIIHGPIIGRYIITFLQGMASGPIACACISMWREWAPVNERTSLLVLAFSGQLIQLYVTFSISIFLAEQAGPFSIYYFSGIAGLIWCLLWNTLIYESPANDHLITVDELCYIEEKIPPEGREKIPLKTVPVKSILTSLPAISLFLVFFTMSFLKRVMLLSGMLLNIELLLADFDPTVSHWLQAANVVLIVPTTGFLVDFLINRQKVGILTMRKIFCCGGLVLHAVFVFLTFVPGEYAHLICHNISFVFLLLCLIGYIPNILELSPRYACVIVAICTTMSRLSGIAFDYILEAVEGGDTHIDHIAWKQVLIPCGVLALITALVFGIFASSDEQTWSLNLLPSRRKPDDSRYYPRSEVEDSTLVSETL